MLRPDGDASHLDSKLVAHFHANPVGATITFELATIPSRDDILAAIL